DGDSCRPKLRTRSTKMNIRRTGLIVILMALSAVSSLAQATYQSMSENDRAIFVAERAKQIGFEISGRNYEFTPAFIALIKTHLDGYVQRIGNNQGDRLWKGDVRLMFERGQQYAPAFAASFKANKVSPLIGIYLPAIESEYINIDTPNTLGALGMFQFLPQTGERFGLSREDLLDVNKSANAAARYIAKSTTMFQADPMKEALALLAYNRGENNVARDLAGLADGKGGPCSICSLTESSDRLDATFREENMHYVPRFFAAAIIGENPGAFG